MIVALSGYGGSGKDTVGAEFVQLGYTRFAFADPLKEIASELLGIPLAMFHDPTRKLHRLPEWGLSPVEICLKLGTEVGRNIHPDIWVRKTIREIAQTNHNNKIIITDLRFPNEAKAVRDAGGLCVRLSRYGSRARLDPHTGLPHVSDIALDDWPFDAHFNTNEPLKLLSERVKAFEKQLRQFSQ